MAAPFPFRLGPAALALAVLCGPALPAQSQPTFFEAFADGQDAMRQGRWRPAVARVSKR